MWPKEKKREWGEGEREMKKKLQFLVIAQSVVFYTYKNMFSTITVTTSIDRLNKFSHNLLTTFLAGLSPGVR